MVEVYLYQSRSDHQISGSEIDATVFLLDLNGSRLTHRKVPTAAELRTLDWLTSVISVAFHEYLLRLAAKHLSHPALSQVRMILHLLSAKLASDECHFESRPGRNERMCKKSPTDDRK